MLLEGLLPVFLQNHVLRQGVIQHQAMLMPILRHVAHAGDAPLANAGPGNVLAAERYVTAAGLFQPRQRGNEFRLAVALDARPGTRFLPPARPAKRFSPHRFCARGFSRDRFRTLSTTSPGFCCCFSDHEVHIPAYHHPGKLLLGGVLNLHRAHVAYPCAAPCTGPPRP